MVSGLPPLQKGGWGMGGRLPPLKKGGRGGFKAVEFHNIHQDTFFPVSRLERM